MIKSADELGEYLVIFKALSNPHRVRILLAAVEELRQKAEPSCAHGPGAACQREYAEGLDIAPSTMSHHLKELANAGLLTIRRDGQRISWGLNRAGIRALRLFIDNLEL